MKILELYKKEYDGKLSETEIIGIATCHKILNEVEHYRLTKGAREEKAETLEDKLGVIEEDIHYLEELKETLDDFRSQMPSHSFERMTITGMQTFTLLNSEEVSSAFMSAGIKINFHLDNRRHYLEWMTAKFIQLS